MSLLSRFAIDAEVVRSIIDVRYGGHIDGILHAWEESDLAMGKQKSPSRSSLRRWVAGLLPRSQHDLWSLCSLLDADPFALIVVTRNGDRLHGDGAFSVARALLWLTPGLGFIQQIFGRQEIWPPISLGSKALPIQHYFPEGWHTAEFTHDALGRVGFNQCIELSAVQAQPGPRVWHFAYRPVIETGRWLQYGSVARFQGFTRLLNARGYLVEQQNSASAATFVETWFGPGPAVFRVASLHPFECRLVEGVPADCPAPLRFVG